MPDKTCESCEHATVTLHYECPVFGGLRETEEKYCYNCEVVV